jgi:NADPH:quinone reductase-like Zn-dependent oxidoreductase
MPGHTVDCVPVSIGLFAAREAGRFSVTLAQKENHPMRCKTLALIACALLAGPAGAAPDKMQAVEVGPDGGLSIQTRPVPWPKAGEVLIKVRAAGVNPVDWKSAQRRMGMVPGTDVSGTIDAVADGVTGWKAGDQVLGFARDSGSYAEYAVVAVNSLARRPTTMTFEQAAGVPIASETAYRSLHEATKVQRGQTVLIHGAAGGVGSAAVQIAKAAGARVIGTASPNNHEFLRSLGADEVIDYTRQKFEDVVDNVDVVLNAANGETNARSIGVLKPGGVLVSIVGAPDAAACEAAKIHCTRPMRDKGASNAELLARVVELAEAGKLKVFVEQVFPMDQAQQAWEKSRTGHTRGKLVIRVSEGPTMKRQ